MAEEEDEAKLRESKNKDSKALCFIQQAVDGLILDRIDKAEMAHEAWEIVKKQYQWSEKMKTVRKQLLKQSFETLQMEDGESIQNYFARVVAIVNQVKGLGEKLTEAAWGSGQGVAKLTLKVWLCSCCDGGVQRPLKTHPGWALWISASSQDQGEQVFRENRRESSVLEGWELTSADQGEV